MPTRIREVIQGYFKNNQSKKVKKIFDLWINRPIQKDEKEAALSEIWEDLDTLPDASTEKSFEKLLSTIQSEKPVVRKEYIPLTRRLSRIAAILILPIISVGVTYYLMKNSATEESRMHLVECIVPNGEMRTIVLPDSSIVKVNSGSIIIYPEKFTDSRDIFLNGEAYFTVTRDETKPFIVKTTDIDIEVLGTVFNVSSYADSENSSATLESGQINIRFKDTDQAPLILQPDEQLIYDRSSKSVKKNPVNVGNITSWTEGNTFIQSLTMEELAKVIERKYAVKVNLNANKYRNDLISVKMSEKESISELMTVLQYLVPHMKYKIENNELYIY